MKRLFGIFADPVAHSLSPAMHNLAFETLGMDAVYLPFQITKSQLPQAIASIRTLNMGGVNLSMPHKETGAKLVDKLEGAAKLVGAINTIVNDNGVLVGHLTDGKGFLEALKGAEVDMSGLDVVMLGAGGAAKAVAVQAALDGAKTMTIYNRTLAKAQELADLINEHTDCRAEAVERELLDGKIKSAQLLINGTGIGMKPYENESLVTNPDVFHQGLVVADMIYNPPMTKLMELAHSQGCLTINGNGMLLHQGAAAFELWTGKPFPTSVVQEVLFHD